MARIDEKKLQNKPVNRFVLERYSGRRSRHTCPNCNTKYSFTRFLDVTNGEYIGDDFGRCDRVEKCGYFRAPTGDDISKSPIMIKPKEALFGYPEEDLNISLIDSSKVIASMSFQDNLSKFLLANFDAQKVMNTLVKYKLGESLRWKGATVFWQIDQDFDTRTGKVILYHEENGKRVKEPRPHISWEHVPDKYVLDKSFTDFHLKQCIFGEHLVTPETTEIHVVESEKTALLCNLIDGKTWLAVGGIEMINEDRLLPFKHCKITFYPDKGAKALDKWRAKLLPIGETFNISINTSLEKSTLKDGDDLGDLIINKYSKKNGET